MPDHPGSAYAEKTILVTGGAGAIGGNLVAALVRAGAKQVIVLDDMSAGFAWVLPDDPAVTLRVGSVVDADLLDEVFAAKPDVVFHLAALFANQNSVDHPELDLRVNGLGTLRVLEHARDSGAGRVVFASTASTYGCDSPLPFREHSMSLRLGTPYQVTKMLGELYVNYFSHQYGMDIVRTRFFNSYGPGEVPGSYRNVIPNFFYWAMNGMPLPITGTGEETRDFTFVEDIVDGVLRAGSVPAAAGQAMNLASGREVTVHRLAEAINRLTGNAAGVVRRERRHWDTNDRLWASIDYAKELLGYEPRTQIDEGLERTAEWFEHNWDAICATARFETLVSA